MTTLLQQAFAAAESLPSAEQDRLAARLLAELGKATSGGKVAVLADPEQWIAVWRAWSAQHRPTAHVVDDSRETIYEGRGE